MKTAGLITGILLMFVSGVMFAVGLLEALSSDRAFSPNTIKAAMMVLAAGFFLGFILSVVSAIFVWPEFKRNLKEKQKWRGSDRRGSRHF